MFGLYEQQWTSSTESTLKAVGNLQADYQLQGKELRQ